MENTQTAYSSQWNTIAYTGLLLAVLLVVVRFYGFPPLSRPSISDSTLTEAQPSWHIRNESSFSIELPGEPVVTRITGRNATDAGYREYDVLSTHNGSNMIVIEMMEYLPQTQVLSGDAVVSDAFDKIKTVENVQIATSSRYLLDGHPAARADFYDPGNGQWTKAVLMYVDGNPRRYFTISELSKDGRYTEGDFERMIHSLNVQP